VKLTYGNQTIDLGMFSRPGFKIILSISGGLDSASLLYLICKYFPDVTIYPVTGRDIYAPFDTECAIDVVAWAREHFPNNKIQEHIIWDFDDLDLVMTNRVVTGDLKHLNVGFNRDRGVVKSLLMNAHLTDYYAKLANIVPPAPHSDPSWSHDAGCWETHNMVIALGTTMNPPIDEMKANGFYDLAERRRDPGDFKLVKCISYKPYGNVDKKFVAGIYEEHGLMEDLFPLTNSCIGTKKDTNYFTKLCKKCFWCKEKYWAFKQY
jgi:hypothetical protein